MLRHVCTGCTVCRGAMRPTWMLEGRATQEQLPRWQRATHVQDVWADVCSCNICTSAIRGGRIRAMQYEIKAGVKPKSLINNNNKIKNREYLTPFIYKIRD